jgi:hypothetical protein
MTDRKARGSASEKCKKTDDLSQMTFGTIQSVVNELERSGRKLNKSGKGHRALLRDTLQTAQRIIVKFLDDESASAKMGRLLPSGLTAWREITRTKLLGTTGRYKVPRPG